MKNYDYQAIDDLIHSRIRLAIMSILLVGEDAEFNFIKKKINATDGNLSVHLRKLEEAKYISVKKEFIDRKPVSKYSLTELGRTAFEDYIKKLEEMIK